MTTRRSFIQSLPITGAALCVATNVVLDRSPLVVQNAAQKPAGEGLPVFAMIYSHSHAGYRGGVLSNEELASGKIEIIASKDFMNHTISENVYAGNAMSRRLF